MKRKLNFSGLKVKSFITDLNKEKLNTVKGGVTGFPFMSIECYWTNGGCTGINCGSANPC